MKILRMAMLLVLPIGIIVHLGLLLNGEPPTDSDRITLMVFMAVAWVDAL